MPFQKMIVALNGVEEEILVIQKAFALKKSLGAQMQVLHVNDPDAGEVHMMMDHFPKIERDDLKELIVKAGCGEEIESIDFLILTENNPIDSLIKVSQQSDLLIMGHHKKNALLAFLADSTDERVADKAECPVLLIPIKNS